ncbi:MAG: HEPN domain-containing protein [Acidimicrobiales bacterium]
MPRQARTRAADRQQTLAYVRKAEEFVEAAAAELSAGRAIAATSLAIHAAVNAADAVTGSRLGKRSAGQDHDEVLRLLAEAGLDGAELSRELARLLPMKTKSEYEPDDVPRSAATKAVERARRCLTIAQRVVGAAGPSKQHE